MMTQWGHDQSEPGARAKRLLGTMEPSTARTTEFSVALSLALIAVMVFGGALAGAAERPLRSRHIVISRSHGHVLAHRAKPVAASVHAHTGRNASYRLAENRGHRTQVRAVRFDQRNDAQRSPSLHRVSARRRRERRRQDEPEAIAQASRREAERPATATQQLASAKNKGATVNAERAATKPVPPASGVYASGVSHPNDDVSEVVSSTAEGTQASPVAARIDAAPADRRPEPPQRSEPSDFVGAPLVAQQRPARSMDARDAHDTPRSLEPTHEELAEAVERPVLLPGLYRDGRLVVPPPMRGTREILMHQNLIADEEGLTRIQDGDDLRRMRAEHMLVDFSESASLRVNPDLAGDRRCARPWTVRFAENISRAFYARFHEPLQVNSAVRTVAYQVRLRRVNGNAAGTGGDMASPHLTGEALDFGKRDMSTAEIAWMRLYLRPLMESGKLDVEEEFQQACFHISVYRAYAPDMPAIRHHATRSEYAQLRAPSDTEPRQDEDR